MRKNKIIRHLVLAALIVLSIYFLFFAPLSDGVSKGRRVPSNDDNLFDIERSLTHGAFSAPYKNYGP